MNEDIDFSDIYFKLYDNLTNVKIDENILNDFVIVKNKDVENKNGENKDVDSELKNSDKIKYINEQRLEYYVKKYKLGYNLDKDDLTNKLLFNLKVYLFKIVESYDRSKRKIYEQYKLDFPRGQIFYNNMEIKKPKELLNKLEKYRKNKIKTNKKYFSVSTLVIMLCNQSSYAFPYTLMHHIYSNYEKSIFIQSMPTNRYVKIKEESEKEKEKETEENKFLSLELSVDFGIKNLDDDNIVSMINVLVKFKLNSDRGILEWKLF